MPAEVLQIFSDKERGINALASVDKPVYIPPQNKWFGGMTVRVVSCHEDSYTLVTTGHVPNDTPDDEADPNWVADYNEIVLPGLPYRRRIIDARARDRIKPYDLIVTHISGSDRYGRARLTPDADVE